MTNPVLSFTAQIARLLPMPIKRAIYRSGPLARWIRSSLNRAVPPGLSPVQVAAGGLAGRTLLLDLQAEKDYWLGTYEPELQAAITDLVRPGSIAYDVGANIGYISLLLAQAAGEHGAVYAFEALPANLERLRQNLALNEMEDRVRVIPGAVSNTSSPVRFLIGPSGGMGKAEGSAGRQELVYSQAIQVQGIVLDEFVYQAGNPAPQIVKMDIEGGEVLALPGMHRVLTEARPIILMELHGRDASQAAWRELHSAGYLICRMEKSNPAIPSLDALGWKAYIVAFPKDD